MQTALSPYFRRKYLLTKSERSFYDVLRDIAIDHMVFAKVRLADLVNANERHQCWQANFRRVCSKHIDFVVCDSDLKPKIAIELDDSSHRRPDREQRDIDVDPILKLAGLPLLRVFVRKQYDLDLIRRRLLAALS